MQVHLSVNGGTHSTLSAGRWEACDFITCGLTVPEGPCLLSKALPHCPTVLQSFAILSWSLHTVVEIQWEQGAAEEQRR